MVKHGGRPPSIRYKESPFPGKTKGNPLGFLNKFRSRQRAKSEPEAQVLESASDDVTGNELEENGGLNKENDNANLNRSYDLEGSLLQEMKKEQPQQSDTNFDSVL